MIKPENDTLLSEKLLEEITPLLIEALRTRSKQEPRLREDGPTIKGDNLTFYIYYRKDPEKHNLSIGRSKDIFVFEEIEKILKDKELICKQVKSQQKEEAYVYKQYPNEESASHFSCEEIADIINYVEEKFNAYILEKDSKK